MRLCVLKQCYGWEKVDLGFLVLWVRGSLSLLGEYWVSIAG